MNKIKALEKNILLYRAIEMSLHLFYAEEIKRILVSSVGPRIKNEFEKDLKGGALLKAIFEKLCEQNLLSNKESSDLQDLIEHRNKIAHHIHDLTKDIRLNELRSPALGPHKCTYDYTALDKIRFWHKEIENRIGMEYILVMAMAHYEFYAAEHAYETELKRLRSRIDRQYCKRKLEIEKDETPNKAG